MTGPGTNNSEAPTPIWGFGPPAPEPDTKKLDALLASLNGSAERFQTLWFSFLGLTLYLAITALATTHRMLLLGEPQTLPILNIKVELLPFYIIAPLLYLVFHFYLLMMLALLARTAAEFDKQLRTTIAGEPELERYRAQVGNALFLQLLVGMKGERIGVNTILMGLIALITIALAPLATLVLMQMMFLPYHHLRITWWHRVIVVADLILIVVMTYRCFFPRGVRKAPLVLGALSRKPRWAIATAFCVLLAVVLWPAVRWLSFEQGRWAGEPRTSSWPEWAQWMAGTPPESVKALSDYAATEDGVIFHLFPDRLRLASETIVGEAKLEETKKEMASRGGYFVPTIALDGRDLQAADLSGADLRGVSPNGVALQGADLERAGLDGARISCEDRYDLSTCAHLQRADLRSAHLQRADLDGAQLQGAALNGARLHGARISCEDRYDLSTCARLDGADLRSAQLQGADLRDACLQRADLDGAQLQGAALNGAQLQGADLHSAQLQGADLDSAQLQGANLVGAQLQGADLDSAQLQGTDLSRPDPTENGLVGDPFFRTSIADADLSAVTIGSTPDKAILFGERLVEASLANQPEVDAWIVAATQFATEERKEVINQRFDRLKPHFQSAAQDAADAKKWAELAKQLRAADPDGARHRKWLAEFFGDLACGPHSSDDAPYVARMLIGRPRRGLVAIFERAPGRLAELGDQLMTVRDRMKEGRKDPKKCPGVAGFTEDDWLQLDTIKRPVSKPAFELPIAGPDPSPF